MRIDEITQPLNEVLASPYPYKMAPVSIFGTPIIANFASQATDYSFYMDIDHVSLEDGSIVIMGIVTFEDDEGGMKLTGKGDAFRVMATVIEILKKVVNDPIVVKRYVDGIYEPLQPDQIPNHIELLIFSASVTEPSRVRLYTRLAKNASGYSVLRSAEGKFVLLSNKTPPDRAEMIKKARFIRSLIA